MDRLHLGQPEGWGVADLKTVLLLSTSLGSKAGLAWLPFQPPRPDSSILPISAL